MSGYVDLIPMLEKFTKLESLTINVRSEDNYQVSYDEQLQRHLPAEQRPTHLSRPESIDERALELWLDGKDPHSHGVDVSIIPDHLQDGDISWAQPRVDPPLDLYTSYHDLFNCALRGCEHLWPNWEWRLSGCLEDGEVAQLGKLTNAVMTGKFEFRLFIRHVLHVRRLSDCTRLVSFPPSFCLHVCLHDGLFVLTKSIGCDARVPQGWHPSHHRSLQGTVPREKPILHESCRVRCFEQS